jgi:hypothetical protein
MSGPATQPIAYSPFMTENRSKPTAIIHNIWSANPLGHNDYRQSTETPKTNDCKSVGRGFEPRPPHSTAPRPRAVLDRPHSFVDHPAHTIRGCPRVRLIDCEGCRAIALLGQTAEGIVVVMLL